MARMDINNVVVGGNLTKKPELRYTTSQKPVTTITVANNQGEFNGEQVVNFIEVVVWGKQAENVCNFLNKGSSVIVEGAIQTRNYEGQDGKRVYVTEVLARRVYFNGGGSGSNNNNNENTGNTQSNNNYSSDNNGSAGYGGASSNSYNSNQPSSNDAPGGGIVLDISDDDIPF